MNLRPLSLAATSLLFVACQGAPVDGHALTLLYGQREFSYGDIDPADEQDALGIEYTRPASGYDFELGLATGSESERLPGGGDVEVSTLEVYGGVRHVFGHSGDPFRPYISGGVAALRIERDAPVLDDDDLDLGIYFRIGAYVPLGEHLRVGLDLRRFQENPFDFGDLDSDFRQITFTLGFGF